MISTLRRQLQQPRFVRSVSQALAEPAAWNQPNAIVTTLPNGVRIATKESFGEVPSVGVFIDAGVRNETKATAGATRLIEKLALTGTAKRPKAQLEKEVELMGGELSVNAGREQTSYLMSGGDVAQGVQILSDLVTAPGLGGWAKEKEAILRNLEESEQPNRAVLDDRLHTCAFRDCSLGFSAIGPYDGAGMLTEAQLQSYVSSNYTAENIVLAASGPVQHAELVKLASSGPLAALKAGPEPVYERKPYFCGAELIYRNDEMGPTAYVTVAFEGVPLKSALSPHFTVFKHLIGSYQKNTGLVPGTISGNRTINNVANKMGVGCADEFETFNIQYKDTGMFGFYISMDEVAVEHAISELMFSTGLMSFAVTDEEVARAKREALAAIFQKSETTAGACLDLGHQMLGYGRYVSPAEMMLRINAIDAEEVKRVAWDHLNDAEVAVTALGPLHGMPQYMDIRRQTNMHRY
jgi:processing peptidase subunit beta